MTQPSPRIGIIGLGRWAEHYHLPGIVEYEGCRLTAVADTNTERVASLGDRLGGAKVLRTTTRCLMPGWSTVS